MTGVRVGHVAVTDEGSLPERGSVGTGVTAVLPHGGSTCSSTGLQPPSTSSTHSRGRPGQPQVPELGVLETPVAITGTLSVGTVFEGPVQHALTTSPDTGRSAGTVNPVAAECSDARLSDIRVRAIQPGNVFQAISAATRGPVAEGSVGGTGMICYGWKAGVGTAAQSPPSVYGGGSGG